MEELNKSFITVSDLAKFNACVLEVFNKEAPIKKKYLRANEAPFMNRKLKKAIIIRSRLRNTFLKHPTNENKKNYRKQRNFCVSLLRKEKKKFFENLPTKNIIDNKTFWKTVQPLLSDKCRLPVTLVKENDVISDNGKIAGVFNDLML